MKRWALATAAGLTLAALLPAVPASATDATTVVLVSTPGSPGSLDPDTELSLDNGTTWQPAVRMAPHPSYSILPDSGWISDAQGGTPRPGFTTLFRRTFDLPAGFTGGGAEVCVHTDNSARISLNGNLVGAQPAVEQPMTFQDPAECFTAPGTLLQPGVNVLEFAVRNYSGPMGLDYRATVSYDRVNAPPVLDLPEDSTVEATGPEGAAVEFAATATDDTGAQVSCDPASGGMFALGTTTVTCTATDDDGVTTSGSFTVTVVDTTAPTLGELPDLAATAGPDGTSTVDVEVTATDAVDPAPVISCEPASGSTFPVGPTTVTCTAADASGNTSEDSFTVTVTDVTAPQLAQLPDLQATAGPGGTATVTWSATATDNADPAPAVSCDPASGAVFPVGPMTVTCTATDASGNSSSDTFVVTVVQPRDVMDRLRDAIQAANVNSVTRAVLLLGHRVADVQLDAGRTRAGCALLQVLDAGIRASSRVIPAADAATMRALIAEARSTYAC